MSMDERWGQTESERLARLAAFPEQNPNPVLGLDQQGVAYANPAARELFPDLRESGEDHALVSGVRRIVEGIEGMEGSNVSTGEVKAGGTYYHLDVQVIPETGDLHVYATDITERRESHQALLKSRERLYNLVEHAADALFVHDQEGRIREANRSACKSLGYSREELLELSIQDVEHDLDLDELSTLWEGLSPDRPVTMDGAHRCKDGSTFPVEVAIGALDYGEERLVLASARDVSGRQRIEEELSHRNHHDPLTGLPNRTLLDARLKDATVHAARDGRDVAVMLLRLGGLDRARERLGYRAGDRLLSAAARRIMGCLGPEDTIGRVGGDDLVMLAESAGDGEQATETALDILEDLNSPLPLEDEEFQADATIGVVPATGGPSGEADHDPLDAAYQAMCRARLRGEPYESYS